MASRNQAKDKSTYIAGNITNSFGAILIFSAKSKCCRIPGPHVCSEMRVETLPALLVQKRSFADEFS